MMRKIFMANGLRRSGNHAISTWVISSILGEEVVLDHGDSVKKWSNKLRYRNNGKFCSSVLINKFENVYLGLESKHAVTLEDLKNYTKKYDLLLYIPILRNPINHVPSVYSHVNCPEVLLEGEYVHQWRKFYDMTKFEGSYKTITGKTLEVVPILYDKWCVDKDYRYQIASKLGIPTNDLGRNIVSGYGCGSSFDGISYRKQASSMKVLERWKQFNWSPETLGIVDSLKDQIEELFGLVPDELDARCGS